MQDNNGFNGNYIPPNGYNNQNQGSNNGIDLNKHSQNQDNQNSQNQNQMNGYGYSNVYYPNNTNGYNPPPQNNQQNNQYNQPPQNNQGYNNQQPQYNQYTQPPQYTQPQYPQQNYPQYYQPQPQGYQNNYSKQTYYEPVDVYDTDVPERKKIRKTFNGIGLTLICQVVLMYILVYIMGTVLLVTGYGNDYTEDGTWIIHFWEAIECSWLPAVSSIIMFFIFNAITKYKPKELFSTKNFSPKFVIISVIVVLFFQQISILLMTGLSNVLYGLGYEVLFNYEMSPDAPTQIADLFATIILAPIAEEMFYRGIILRATAKVSQRYAIFFSALIFGMMHGNPYQMILGFLIGIVFGYITVKTGSIIPAIICHMANNFVASLPDLVSYINEDLYDAVSIGLMAGFLIIGLAVFVIVLSSGKIKMPEYTLYHKHRTTPIILTSIAVYVAIGIYIYQILGSITPIATTT